MNIYRVRHVSPMLECTEVHCSSEDIALKYLDLFHQYYRDKYSNITYSPRSNSKHISFEIIRKNSEGKLEASWASIIIEELDLLMSKEDGEKLFEIYVNNRLAKEIIE